jgi:hypothetical protein
VDGEEEGRLVPGDPERAEPDPPVAPGERRAGDQQEPERTDGDASGPDGHGRGAGDAERLRRPGGPEAERGGEHEKPPLLAGVHC